MKRITIGAVAVFAIGSTVLVLGDQGICSVPGIPQRLQGSGGANFDDRHRHVSRDHQQG